MSEDSIKKDEELNSIDENQEDTDKVNQEVVDESIFLKTKISELENEIAELKDKFLRKAAEFENYKRRVENEQLNLIKYAAENFITRLLPVIDDFERSLQHVGSAKDINSVTEGVKLIYDKLMKLLDEQGVKKIEAIGKPFDVEYHEALMQRKAEGILPNTVLDEIQSGYIYKDRVIRHSKVIVSEDSHELSANDQTINPIESDNSD
ncbi:MAG: nucleotide exchange factor GrpE [Ignavibacteriaceae bacterium]|nr:nucleotide exchange factor GrpE [Ignavibacteriaceae bacterium]